MEHRIRTALSVLFLLTSLTACAPKSQNIDYIVDISEDPSSASIPEIPSTESPKTIPSDFLRQKILDQAAEIDAKYGADAYGGTNWLFTEGGYTEEDLYTIVEVSNGEILLEPLAEATAPLSIKTSGNGGYYIYLEPLGDVGAQLLNVMSFYVEAGKTAEVLVPLGEYNIYYATGSTWYGTKYLFGINTQYYKCDSTFDFKSEGDYQAGFELTLYPVANGNMDSNPIAKEDFPR